jgi:hypothetical protein
MTRAYQSRPDLCRREVEDLIRRNRVLLAVYMLADEQGLVCRATDAALSRASGVSFSTARGHLHALVEAGDLVSLKNGSRTHDRVLVLADHPQSRAAVAALKRSGRYRWCNGIRVGP